MTSSFFIGVTGHRPHKLNPARLGQIEGDIRSVFTALQQAVRPRPLACLCSLAEGADTMAARAALDLGWTLMAPLPFPLDDFADDFAAGSARDQFYDLAAKAKVTVCTKGRTTLPNPDLGYVAASAAVLEQSTVLVAVWDGQGTHLAGGAYDTIRLAIGQAIPVLWIDAKGHAPPCHLAAQDEQVLASGMPLIAPLDSLIASLS